MPTIMYKVENQWVACQVLAKIDEDYQIRYWDEVTDQYRTLFVHHDDLKFPKFEDLMFC